MKLLITLIMTILLASHVIGQIGPALIQSYKYKNDQHGTGVTDYGQSLLFGSGAFRTVLSEGDLTETGDLNGSVGYAYANCDKHAYFFELNLADASNLEMNDQNTFADAILLQELKGQTFELGYINNWSSSGKVNKKGIGVSIMGSLQDWKFDSTTAISAFPVAGNVQYVIQHAPKLIKPTIPRGGSPTNPSNPNLFLIKMGYTVRVLTNNVGLKKYEDLRMVNFNTAQTWFHGAEIDLEAHFNSATVYLNFITLFPDHEIEGLTGLRINFGIVLTGNVLNVN